MGTGLLEPTHVIFLIVVALLVFGPKRLPEMGRSIGQGIREFKDSINGEHPDTVRLEVKPDTSRHAAARSSQLPPAEPASPPNTSRRLAR